MSKQDVGQMENSTVWDNAQSEHPLQTDWAFWYDKKQNKKVAGASEYRASLVKLGSFNTVESFWKLYLYLKRPSVLDVNVNLYLFRDGPDIAPMWECFPKGGCWILKVKKKLDTGASVLGKMWHDMVLSTIGELFEEPDVVGISVHIRSREDLISVWNKDNTNDDVRFHIGEKMKQILDLEPSTMIEYKHHATSMRDMSSFRNAKGYVFAPAEKNNAPPKPPTLEEEAAAAVANVGV
mmetsp:Transcript_3605/g.5593  ORF Transcript_3605/g.5593 Transcript_3605/m.5593 type:complete len:237 (-) Transcript_3605:165-875(-)|eukprot:CAMPEP_0185018962 /NCGR_PEP_ID=MMETSP1103-20130426/1613_1 /TAXON_ID=36769 /ORGANISM="Paraphysomonas bandaiensis, Strain Caron Lab Isolate" /LENGTH=236 /DNA_ID=CAMNT_0027549017 /DNA_START=169 /DNA_END=879 /DNA_ORIENTATION=-